MINQAVAHINTQALRDNLARVAEIAPGCKVMAMIKGNAYGHGILEVTHSLAQADSLGVARLHEALLLKQAGVQQRIVILEGFLFAEELATINENQFDIVLHHQSQVDVLEQMPNSFCGRIWIKMDSGMSRLGFSADVLETVRQRVQASQGANAEICFMTHFAKADEDGDNFTLQQIDDFSSATVNLAGDKSLANSAAILTYPQTHADWVRPGLMLYGASPFADQVGPDLGLKPVMTLRASLMAINYLKKGSYVGYGCTWRCPEDMPVGVVGIGYADGYPRLMQNGAPVLIGDTIVPLAGRVSMDMITLDLRGYPQAKVGQPIVLWGEGLPVETVAQYANTISYQLLTGVTSRVRFVYD